MKITMLKRAKPRGFNYKPRFYNPEQEAREERKKQVLGADYKEAYEDDTRKKEYVPGQYVHQGGIRRSSSGISSRLAEKKRPSSRIILIALALLLGIVAWLYLS